MLGSYSRVGQTLDCYGYPCARQQRQGERQEQQALRGEVSTRAWGLGLGSYSRVGQLWLGAHSHVRGSNAKKGGKSSGPSRVRTLSGPSVSH